MSGLIVGYIRVSTVDQSTERQLLGETLGRVFTDKASGKHADRPALNELMAFVREGDVVVVHSMDRLARNLVDLRRIVEGLTTKGVRVKFLKEGQTFSGGADSATAKLMLSIMGAFAEFERALLLERQREGIALAKAKGVYRGRRAALSVDQQVELRRRAAGPETITSLAKVFGVSRETVYQYIRPTAQPASAIANKLQTGTHRTDASPINNVKEDACQEESKA